MRVWVGVLGVLMAILFAARGTACVAGQPSFASSAVHAYRITVHPDHQPPLTLFAQEMGRGPVLLLLHGLGGSSYTWRAVAPALAAHHRVIAVDMRGFGRSDKPLDLAYGPRAHADAIRAFIVERRLSGVTLIGHSYGGVVALLLAMDHRLDPQRISRLVLIDAPALPQPASPGVEFLRQPVLPYVALTLLPPQLPIAVALMMEKFGIRNFNRHDVEIYADPLTEPGGVHALIETAVQIVPPDFDRIIAGYRGITKPALVLNCREDEVVPLTTARRLARTLPNARLAVLEGCDHMPPEQTPEAVLRALAGFVGR